MNNKLAELKTLLSRESKVAVAFSGGVDSTLMAMVSHMVLGDNALAITVNTPYIPDWEIAEAKELAEKFGIRHKVLELDVPEAVAENPADRCYVCKGIVFREILSIAAAEGIDTVFDGTNADDSKDYRPGLRALAELNVRSPLQEVNLTKAEIRQISRELGLPTWDKPAYACLLTRLPYGTTLDENDFRLIEQAEVHMMNMGFRAVRVRKFGDLAKIEVDREILPKLLDMTLFDAIVTVFKKIGFKQVALDMSGYRTGSMNDQLNLESGDTHEQK